VAAPIRGANGTATFVLRTPQKLTLLVRKTFSFVPVLHRRRMSKFIFIQLETSQYSSARPEEEGVPAGLQPPDRSTGLQRVGVSRAPRAAPASASRPPSRESGVGAAPKHSAPAGAARGGYCFRTAGKLFCTCPAPENYLFWIFFPKNFQRNGLHLLLDECDGFFTTKANEHCWSGLRSGRKAATGWVSFAFAGPLNGPRRLRAR